MSSVPKLIKKAAAAAAIAASLTAAASLVSLAMPQDGAVETTAEADTAADSAPGSEAGSIGSAAAAGNAQDAADDPSGLVFEEGFGGTGSSVSISSMGESGGIDLDFTYGYRNIAKSGRKLPFDIRLTNNTGEDFDGSLVIDAPGSVETGRGEYEDAGLSYTYSVSIRAGESTDIRDTISIAGSVGTVTLSLYDSSGTRVCSESDAVNASQDGAELLIGILSDSPEKLEYFRGISVAGTVLRTNTVELAAGDFLSGASGLDQLDVIIISGYDTAAMDAECTDAINSWVELGGVLLLGSGRDSEAVRVFGEDFDGFTIGEAERAAVDLGMKYSNNGPDGAVLELWMSDIFVEDGLQVMQTSDAAMLTTVSKVNGIVGFAACDLCELSDFCTEEISYTDDLLGNLLGSTRISGYISSSDSGRELYEKAERFLNIANMDRLPGLALYVLLAIAYVAFIGWGLVAFLRRRNLELYYHAFAVITAFAGAFVFWIIGTGSRLGNAELDYAAIREIHGDSVSDSGYFRMLTASADSCSLSFPADYEVHPVLHEPGRPMAGAPVEEPGDNGLADAWQDAAAAQTDAAISVARSDDGSVFSVSGANPFTASIIEFSRRTDEAGVTESTGVPDSAGATESAGLPDAADNADNADNASAGLSALLSYDGTALSGTVTNDSGYTVTDAAVLFYGHVALIGDMEPGESIDASGLEVLTSTVADTAGTASFVTGSTAGDPSAADMRKAELLSYYMQESMLSYYSGVRVVGFTEDSGLPLEVESDITLSRDGLMLIVCHSSFNESGGRIWRSALSHEPSVVSGEYDASANTSGGAAVIEYNLGTDISIESLRLSALSDTFAGGEAAAFSGQISLYNYYKGSYDLIGDKTEFDYAELAPYLSPSNTLMVRFLPGDTDDTGSKAFLPLPEACGFERRGDNA